MIFLQSENFINPFDGEVLPINYYFDKSLNSSENNLVVCSCLNAINYLEHNNFNLYFKYDTLLKMLLTYKEYKLIHEIYIASSVNDKYCILPDKESISAIIDAFKKIFINIDLFRERT